MGWMWAMLALLALTTMGSIVALIWFGFFYRLKPPSSDAYASDFIDPMGKALDRRVTRDRTRRRTICMKVAAGTLLGSILIFFILFALVGVDTEKMGLGKVQWWDAPDRFQVTAIRRHEPASDKDSNALSAYWAALGFGGFAVLVGALLLIFGKSGMARGSGVATLAFGLFTHASLIKEVKFGDLLKFETSIDKLAELTLKLDTQRGENVRFHPRLIATVSHFESGKAEIRSDMDAHIKKACDEWHNQRQQERMLQVIGSADRVPLAASTRRQFESNVGLAQARAEQVKLELVKCHVPSEQIMTMIAGPTVTGALPANAAPTGVGEDRSVKIWALWNIAP